MSAPVEWSPRALLGLQKRIEFLRRKNPRAANDAAETIIAAGNRLADFPNLGRPYRNTRTQRELIVPFGQDGYLILYRVLRDEVRILGIKHQREAGY